MRIIEDYVAPSPEDLSRLKERLGYTGNQMADLAGLAGNNQWRKYTGGESPRGMSQHILFFIAAQLTMEPEQLEKIVSKMEEVGAQISGSNAAENKENCSPNK